MNLKSIPIKLSGFPVETVGYAIIDFDVFTPSMNNCSLYFSYSDKDDSVSSVKIIRNTEN